MYYEYNHVKRDIIHQSESFRTLLEEFIKAFYFVSLLREILDSLIRFNISYQSVFYCFAFNIKSSCILSFGLLVLVYYFVFLSSCSRFRKIFLVSV